MKIKNIIQGIATILPFIVTSCSNIHHEENMDEGLCAYFSIERLESAVESRITISPDENGNYNFVWNADEVIGIFPSNGYQEPFEIPSSQAGQGKVTFDGGDWALKSGRVYAAYYPFDKKNFDSKEMKTQIAVSYEGQKQVGEAYGVGAYDFLYTPWVEAPSTGSLDFTFKHLGSLGIFNVTFPASGTYTELSISTKDALIPVNCTYDLTTTNGVALVAKTHTNIHTLVLEECSVDANTVRKFHLWLPPTDLSSHDIKFILKDNNGGQYEAPIASTHFEAGKKYIFNVSPVLTVIDGNGDDSDDSEFGSYYD